MPHSAIFVSDLHGHIPRYEKLFTLIREEVPAFVFLGGDLLPHALRRVSGYDDFVQDYFFSQLKDMRDGMGDSYPDIFVILGNDDYRSEEYKFSKASGEGLFHYLNTEMKEVRGVRVYGYPFVPPTPFQLKDWEKYDVSRYVDPGCVPPTEGSRSFEPDYDTEYGTIASDLERLTGEDDLSTAVMLFHSPPYKTGLDRADLDGKMIDHIPLDVHIGSIAIQRFIETRQPLVTLHGHAHESTRLTGRWQETMNKTVACNAAHDGPELCVVKFPDILSPARASRSLI